MSGEEQVLLFVIYMMVGMLATGNILNPSGFLDGIPRHIKIMLRIGFVFLWFPLMVLICALGLPVIVCNWILETIFPQ